MEIELKTQGNELAKVLHYYGLLEGVDEFKIVCPFHDDVNASMQITLSENFFYCHGCGEHGDAMRFVRLVNKKLDDLQSCKKYFQILKSNKSEEISTKRFKKIRPDNKQALIEAEDFYYGLKTIDWRKIDCFEKEYMKERGFSPDTLNKCKAKLTYGYAYPLVFPMLDMGKFRGWVCRTMDKKIAEKRKYLYNEGFSRRNTLVGNYNNKVVVLVEGYMDYLKMRQNGVRYVAAILGWKITEQQVKKLKDYGVETIVSALDNDTCGEKGTLYLKKLFNVIRFQFPQGTKDPGEMDKKTFDIANNKTKILYRRN